jgi:hypothetical protein
MIWEKGNFSAEEAKGNIFYMFSCHTDKDLDADFVRKG